MILSNNDDFYSYSGWLLISIRFSISYFETFSFIIVTLELIFLLANDIKKLKEKKTNENPLVDFSSNINKQDVSQHVTKRDENMKFLKITLNDKSIDLIP